MAHASNQYRKELNEGGRTISNQDKAKAKAKAQGGLVTNFKGTF